MPGEPVRDSQRTLRLGDPGHIRRAVGPGTRTAPAAGNPGGRSHRRAVGPGAQNRSGGSKLAGLTSTTGTRDSFTTR